MRPQPIWLVVALGLLLPLIKNHQHLPAVPRGGESLLMPQEAAVPNQGHPTLDDFWNGRAHFIVEVEDTGLPMGESESIKMANGELWSYVHASDRSAGVVDSCGDPVEFPGCTVIYRSQDGGRHFQADPQPTCQFNCNQCPCSDEKDHTLQQQYPRVAYDAQSDRLWLVYEYLGHAMLRRSANGLRWSRPQWVAKTGLRDFDESCSDVDRIGEHPFTPLIGPQYCLAGGPPGIFIEAGMVYIFVGMGQSPGHLGCYSGRLGDAAARYRPCRHNPLLSGADSYGPPDVLGAAANPFWNFRMLSAAEVQRVGDRYYMLYEGIRGPGPNDAGDTQFGLGLARSLSAQIDGPWEQFDGNPILVDSPANIGIGHADLLTLSGETILFTSLDGQNRSRLRLVWK